MGLVAVGMRVSREQRPSQHLALGLKICVSLYAIKWPCHRHSLDSRVVSAMAHRWVLS